MTREDVLKIMPNATDEMITAFLNAHHGELQAEKDKSKNLSNSANEELAKYKAEVERLEKASKESGADDLQSQIKKLTEDNEKAQRTIKNMELKANLLGQGFSADDVDAYIKAKDEGGDIAAVLGKMKDNVISAHDKARLENTPKPQGSGSTPPDTKDTASKLVGTIFGDSNNKSTNDILANYKK